MFVLDTCFVSEFAMKVPNTGVLKWLGQQDEAGLFITTLTLGELVKGIERLSLGRKRTELERWLDHDLLLRFHGRIFSFDQAAARDWGRLCATLERHGLTMPAVDSQITAICLVHGADIVTRNSKDFRSTGVEVVNPWT